MNPIHHILIIDDDEELCEELSEFLSDKGYTVDVANDGSAGRRFLDRYSYTLLILDLKLPVETGFDILRDVKKTRAGLKVMVVSGRPPDDSLLEDWEDRGNENRVTLALADCVLSKPIHPELLLQSIQQLAP
ncbi:MAG: response regulator transcription factor [Candidatus Omnitrophota bacterium]